MIDIPGAAEAGKTARSFFDIFREGANPQSLALIAVVAGLVVLLYYSQSQTLEQRRETSALIIGWQKDTDKLMSNCVSQDVTRMMIDNINTVTQTMLNTAQKDIERMQHAIDRERELNAKMMEETLKRLQRYQPPPGLPFQSPSREIGFEECDPLGPFCSPK